MRCAADSSPPRAFRRRLTRGLPRVCALIVLLAADSFSHSAEPVLAGSVPPRVPQAGDMDVTPYLAAAKARAFAGGVARFRAASAAQDAYDVHYYGLDLNLDPAAPLLSGAVRVRATVTRGPLSTFDLDLENGGLTVDAVTSGGVPLSFTHGSDVLSATLEHTYATGEAIDVVVQYHGVPIAGGFGSFTFDRHAGLPMVWTLSEPFGARSWWPCKDQPSDKADSVDIRVTVPTGMKTASNGLRVLDVDDGVHATTQWHESHPIATYLVSVTSFAYYDYARWYRPTPTDSMEIHFYIFAEHYSLAAAVNDSVEHMLALDATLFGPYPFLDEKYGHAEFPFGGGMEHQTCTSLGAWSEYVAAHELAHQWWGDLVTCRDFHHIWLNEGFASYAEALWAEAHGGSAAYGENMSFKRYLGPGTIYVPDLANIERIFDGGLSYGKGAWVLHMLRHALGDAVFFEGLRHYRAQHAYASAVTEDFQRAMEDVSGQPLGAFFRQWIYGEGYPLYDAAFVTTPAPGGGFDVTVELAQMQSGQLFTMPVDMVLTGPGGPTRYTVRDSLAMQSFQFHRPDSVTAIAVDPDAWILDTVTYSAGLTGSVPGGGALALLAPRPNPCSSRARILYAIARAGPVRATVVDALGRLVRVLENGPSAAGRHVLEWDGSDRHGSAAPNGIYWISVQQGTERRAQKLALVR